MNEIHRHLHVVNDELLKVKENSSYEVSKSVIKDLPIHLFKDPTYPFYQNGTPEQLYEGIDLPVHSDFKRSLYNVKYSCDIAAYELAVIQRFLLKADLKSEKNLAYMFAKLGEFSKIYEEFFKTRSILHRVLLQWSYTHLGDPKYLELYDKIKNIYVPVSDILLGVKFIPNYLPNDDLYILHKNLRDFLYSRLLLEDEYDLTAIRQILIQKIGYYITDAAAFLELRKANLASTDSGLQYQYYNTILTRHTNLSYSGFLDDLNQLINQYEFPVPILLEYPRYFKVTYERSIDYTMLIEKPSFVSTYEPIAKPKKKKIKEVEEVVERSTAIKGPFVDELPEEIKGRKTDVTDMQMTAVDGIIKIKLYDHILLDGDVVSLSFNGDWILENHSLETKPIELELQVNRGGLHYLVIHADNVGKKPPNTVGLEYVLNGETFKKLMQSDMQVSKIINIHVVE